MPAPLSLRRLLAPLVLPIRTRIRSGPNKGCAWSIASGRYLKGTVEGARMRLLQVSLGEGDTVWDVGAHHGYVALHASRCVGDSGQVYAFEPSPYNLTYLRQHLSWNQRANIDLKPIALADRDGTAMLAEAGSSRTFSLGSGEVRVGTASVPSLLQKHELRPPDFLKLDVEGGEGDIVEAAAEHLRPTSRALVAIHSMDNYNRVREAFESVGFVVYDSAGVRQLKATEAGTWGEDPDVLAVGPAAGELDGEVRELLEQT